jgi:hypothetical protein
MHPIERLSPALGSGSLPFSCPGTQMEWDVISEEIDTYY